MELSPARSSSHFETHCGDKSSRDEERSARSIPPVAVHIRFSEVLAPALAGMVLVLVLMVWVPVSVTVTYEEASALANPITVLTTPTEDATVTALNKEKLAQEVQQLKNQNAPDLFGWLRTNASIFLSTLVVVVGGLIGLWRWFGDRRSEREKRAEERFQSTVVGLGDDKEAAKIGAAILLRTFLRSGYEQFYMQTFDLVVANLRAFRTSEYPNRTLPLPEDPGTPLPLTTLRQELITVFKEAFQLARDSMSNSKKAALQSLDATGIQLDNAYLSGADLKQAWMPQASLQKANLVRANLSNANLEDAILRGAALFGGTNLRGANLITADLRANLSEADLREANPEEAQSLTDTKLRGVKGLTKEQLKACKAKGAIIDEGSSTSASQSIVATSPPSKSNDGQVSSAQSVQESTSTGEADGSSAVSSQKDRES